MVAQELRGEMRTIAAVLALGAAFGGSAAACDCRIPSPCQGLREAAAVFTGVATSEGGAPVRFAVGEAFSGVRAGETVAVENRTGSDCEMPYETGRRYLVYAYGNGGATLAAGRCSGSRPLDEAAAELRILRARRAGDMRPRLAGIVRVNPDVSFFENRGQTLAGVAVVLAGERKEYRSITDAGGMFEVAGIAAGVYRAHASLGPLRMRSGPAFAFVDGGGCGVAEVHLFSDGSISGTVRDALGRALAGVRVEAMAVHKDGKRPLVAAGEAVSDRDGRYQLEPLAPGRYMTGVNLLRRPSPVQPFPETRGNTIALGDAQHVDGGEIRLPRALEVRTIRVEVFDGSGKPLPRAHVFASDRSGWASLGFDLRTDEHGRLEVKALRGEKYTLYAMPAEQQGAVTYTPVEVAAGEEPASLRLQCYSGPGADR
jgi:hypothetical protein